MASTRPARLAGGIAALAMGDCRRAGDRGKGGTGAKEGGRVPTQQRWGLNPSETNGGRWPKLRGVPLQPHPLAREPLRVPAGQP